MGTKVHTELSPGIKVALGGNSAAAGPLVDAVADVLGESGGTLDGRLVDLGVLPDVVDGAVAGDLAHLLALRRAAAVGRVFLHVVLDERVGRPAVDGDEDRAGLGLGGALKVDLPAGVLVGSSGGRGVRGFCLPGGSLVPSLSYDKVAGVGEVDRVSVVGRAELHVATCLVVLVVVLAGRQGLGLSIELKVGHVGRGSRKSGTSNGREAQEERTESNHFDRLEVCWW